MTRTDYKRVADVMHERIYDEPDTEIYSVLILLASEFADAFEGADAKFSRYQFMQDCGVLTKRDT